MKHLITILSVILLSSPIFAQEMTAKEILKKADDKQRGLSSKSEMSMTIIRPKWQRTVTMKSWSLGTQYSLIYITEPVKDKGQVFLKRNNEIWNWVPKINRMIKLPPSMMSQGWMGSDFSNDDLLKESSIVVDYTHKVLNKEMIEDVECYKIELIPLEDAAVVWGKVIKWVSTDEFWQLKTEYYDEDFELIRIEVGSEIKQFDDRKLPSKMEIIRTDKPKQKTQITIKNVSFKIELKEDFFSQQNMKRIR